MAERLASVGDNLELYKVHVDELREQDVNARVMPPEMFERLTETVRNENRLEQLPFTVARDGHFEVISGHHRLRAARSAGLTEVFVLADTRDLPRSKVVAKQLAHNAIGGTDDTQTLKRLFDEISSVEDQLESYIRIDDFDDVKQLEPSSATEIGLDIPWRQLSLVFLPDSVERLELLDAWAKEVPATTDIAGVVSMEVFDRFRDSVLNLGRVENVRSLGAIMTRMIEITDEWIEQNDPEKQRDGGAANDRPAGADAGGADAVGAGKVRRASARSRGQRKA